MEEKEIQKEIDYLLLNTDYKFDYIHTVLTELNKKIHTLKKIVDLHIYKL